MLINSVAFQPVDWLQSGIRAQGKRLLSALRPRRAQPALAASIDPILRHWRLGCYRLKAAPGGSTGGTFLIETAAGMRVLRQSDSDERQWLALQLAVMGRLATAGFPYDSPRIVPTAGGETAVFDGRDYWYLYDFIDGLTALAPDNRRRAHGLGRLVGHFAAAVDGLDIEDLVAAYGLHLFAGDALRSQLAQSIHWFTDRRPAGEAGTALRRHGDRLLRCRLAPSDAVAGEVAGLPATAVYYDWHNKNIITRRGLTAGLIDYDSLAIAPSIVDFQNALTYVLISRPEPDHSLAAAFAAGYQAVRPLAPAELRLVHPVMVDRVAWLLAHVLERLRCGPSRGLEERAARLVRLLVWLDESGDRLTGLLAPGPTGGQRPAG